MLIISFSFQLALPDKKVKRSAGRNRTQTLSSLMKMPKSFSWIGDYDDDQYQLSSYRKQQLEDIQHNCQQLKHQYEVNNQSVEKNVGQNVQPHHYYCDDTLCEDEDIISLISVTQPIMQGFETVSAGKLVVYNTGITYHYVSI